MINVINKILPYQTVNSSDDFLKAHIKSSALHGLVTFIALASLSLLGAIVNVIVLGELDADFLIKSLRLCSYVAVSGFLIFLLFGSVFEWNGAKKVSVQYRLWGNKIEFHLKSPKKFTHNTFRTAMNEIVNISDLINKKKNYTFEIKSHILCTNDGKIRREKYNQFAANLESKGFEVSNKVKKISALFKVIFAAGIGFKLNSSYTGKVTWKNHR